MNFGKMFSTIDTHVAGKAFRIVTQSSIVLNEADINANNDYLQANFENEKNLLLNEPRGHRDMHGCILVPSRFADIGLLFFNHDNQVEFTYSGLIATITALLETGNIVKNANDRYDIETAYGNYTVKAVLENGEVRSVYVESKDSELQEKQDAASVINVDGARTYLLYNLPETIPAIDDQHLIKINNWARERCADLVNQNITFDGVIMIEEGSSADVVRSMTFEKDGNILRSPGIDSTIAILTSKIADKESIKELTNESIFGSQLTAKVVPNTKRFSVDTEAFVTGLQDFIYDEDDPLKEGFLLK